jgi:penicillin-binding protein 2
MFRHRLFCGRAEAMVCLLALVVTQAEAQTGVSPLQAALRRAMQGKRGTAVVLDVAAGQVLAAYRPEVAARRLALPGSSLKPFTLLALLQTGKIDGQTALACRRPLTIAGHRLGCSHPQSSRPLDAAAALAYSCNSYFSTVAARLTPIQLRNILTNSGFASPTGLAANEVAGSVALAGNPEQLQLQAIGEWGVQITPLELLDGYRKLALLASGSRDAKLAPLFEGLEGSTSYGMGRLAQPGSSAMRVAGKTGTTPAEGGHWTHAWFGGYAPADKPEIVLIVFLEKGTGGSDAAAVARAVFFAYAADRGGATGARP